MKLTVEKSIPFASKKSLGGVYVDMAENILSCKLEVGDSVLIETNNPKHVLTALRRRVGPKVYSYRTQGDKFRFWKIK